MKKTEYKGHQIIHKHGIYFVLGVTRKTLKAAKTLIDKTLRYE